MKTDEFEKELQRQPLRRVPPEWRSDILRAARAESRSQVSILNSQPAPWWREWLWPSPTAWAGLAAVWLVIAGLNLPIASRPSGVAQQMPKPSLEVETTLADQRRELARLLDNLAESAPRPKAVPPGPRSENFSSPKV